MKQSPNAKMLQSRHCTYITFYWGKLSVNCKVTTPGATTDSHYLPKLKSDETSWEHKKIIHDKMFYSSSHWHLIYLFIFLCSCAPCLCHKVIRLVFLLQVSTYLLWQSMNLAMHLACPTHLTLELSCTQHITLPPIMSFSSPSVMSKMSNICMVSSAGFKRLSVNSERLLIPVQCRQIEMKYMSYTATAFWYSL